MGNARSEKVDRLLAVTRDTFASGRLAESVIDVILCLEYRDQLTDAEAVDLLERSCVYGPLDLVQVVYEQLGPFAYRGWALALALRCARQDVARYLLDKGVDLLEDVRMPELYRAIAAHESSLARFDLTRSSPNLLLNPLEHTVSTEVFAPFTGTDQLTGSSFGTLRDVAATCDVVGRLAGEGRFDSVVFDDLFRAALVRAQEVMRRPGEEPPYAVDALLGLTRRMLGLRRERGLGSDYMDLIMGNLITPTAEEGLVAFICEEAPRVFLGRLVALSWLRQRTELVRRMVSHLSAGTDEQNAALVSLLARSGYLDELRQVVSWPGVATRGTLDAGVAAAAQAGQAECASWLLAQRRALDEGGAGSSAGVGAQAGAGDAGKPDGRGSDLGPLAGLAL